MSEDRIRQWAAAAVQLVAAIAAVVSYLHIETLARSHHQPLLAAVLLPLSVDGTVAAASFQMLLARRGGQKPTGLQRVMLWLGVAATLAANITYGWPGGAVSAVMSGWPALAFIGSAEMAIQSLPAAAETAASRPGSAKTTGRGTRAPRGRSAPRRGNAARPSADATRERVAAAMTERPELDTKGLAALLELSPRTVRRHAKDCRAAA